MEIVERSPEVRVDPAEYRRLLGYPRDHALSERALELAAWAEEWYRQNGRPWLYARLADGFAVEGGRTLLDGEAFSSRRLASTLQKAEAHGAVLVAVGAGAEAEEHAHDLWLQEKPDEYFFLEAFGSAVVENLVTATAARLCAWADSEQIAVLPHYSPGYAQWDLAEQGRLLALVQTALPGKLEALDSGALRPKKSQLAVFGLTRHTDRVGRLEGLIPCQDCALAHCQFRRAPYARAAREAAGSKSILGV
jgi:hypothetical protein